MDLYQNDVLQLSDKFTYGGEVFMDFMIVAVQPESEYSGPEMALSDEAASAKFQVYIVQADETDECASNALAIMSSTYSNEWRDEVIDF